MGLCSKSNSECNLLKAKTLFFIVTLSVVGWTRFQNSFYIDNGLTNTEIGTLKSVGLVCKLFGEPLLCILADVTGHREMFLFCILFNVVSMEVLRTASPLTFKTVMAVKVLRTFAAPTSTLTTTTSLALAEGSKQGYGEQRAFGALGWGVGALISGSLIDAAGMGGLFLYTYSLCALTFVIVYFGVPANAGKKTIGAKREEPDEETASLMEETSLSRVTALPDDQVGESDTYSSARAESPLKSRLGKPGAFDEDDTSAAKTFPAISPSFFYQKYQYFVHSVSLYYDTLCVRGGRPIKVVLVNIILFGIVMSAMDTYLYVSAERDLNASRTVNGLLTTISVGVSVPFFWYSDSLIKKYGRQSIFLISFGLTVFRLFVCAIVTKLLIDRKQLALSIIAVLQLLHGFTFAGYWSSVIDVVSAMSQQQGLLSGSVAVVNALYFTVGGAVGNVLWGFVYDEPGYGMVAVYLLAAIVTSVTFLIQLSIGGGVDEVVDRNRLPPVTAVMPKDGDC